MVFASPFYASDEKRSPTQLLFLALATLAIIVIVLTLIAVHARPTTTPCGSNCGPRSGPRLITASVYTNQQWGYSVEYDSSAMSISGSDQDGVQLQPQNGDGEEDFTATSGSDPTDAVRTAVNNLDTSQFQNLQEIGPVRGAEVGLVPGEGMAYSASFVPSDGIGQAVPVGVVVVAASQNNVTISMTAFSSSDTDVNDAPYGLDEGPLFDFPLTNTIWKGGQ